MSDTISFGVLHPDGRVTEVREIAQADVMRCPNVLLDPAHYLSDGSCLCYDEMAPDMARYGYVWNAQAGVWE